MESDAVYNIDNIQLSLTEKHDKNNLEDLLVQAKSGSDPAFGQLYNLCFEKIYRFIFYRVSHKEVAEDLTEDVFVKAFGSLQSIHQNHSFEAWLYQIARNIVIDYYRSKKMHVPLEEVENTLQYEVNVVDVVNLQTEQVVLVRLLKELTSEQQIVIKLKFFEHLENDEIAGLLDKQEGAIRVIQHRAITKLRELIDQETYNKTTKYGAD